MTGPGRGGGLAVQLARRLARALSTPRIWSVLDDDLQDELHEREAAGWGRVPREIWGAAQYLSVGIRFLPEWMGSRLGAGTGPGSLAADWRLEIRQAIRALRARPMTTMSVIVTVALAVGATTSVYSVVDGVLLEPLPYPESDRLARVWQTRAAWGEASNGDFRSGANRLTPLAPSYYDWLGADTGFESLGAYIDDGFVLQSDGSATARRGQEATSGLFEALAVEPVLGRRLQPEDDIEDATRVVVLAESLWREAFGADPGVLGEEMTLNGQAHVVIGVMPSHFEPPPGAGAGRTLAEDEPVLWTQLTREARRGWKNVSVLGRLSPGVALSAASERLAATQDGMAAIYPDYKGAWAESLLDSVVGDVRSTLCFLLSSVGLVLLVANVNIANVLAASGLGRQRELAVRAALGAGSKRLAGSLLLESALLAAVGGGGGVLLAWLSLPVLMEHVPPSLPRQEVIGMSGGVLFFGLGVTAGTALLTSLLPALTAAKADPQRALRRSAGSVSGTPAAQRIRAGLVVTEVSLAVVLLVGAALLGNSYLRLWSVDRGFATQGLAAMWVEPDPAVHGTREAADDFARALATEIGSLPGLQATVANHLPLSGLRSATEIYVERGGGALELAPDALLTVVLDNYFDVLGIPVLRGRGFGPDDSSEAPPVAMVSQDLARRYWGDEGAVGQRLRTYGDSTTSIRIVGVVSDVRHEGLSAAVAPTVYLPASQSGRDTNEVILRVQGSLGDAFRSAGAAVAALSPGTPVRRQLVLEQTIADSVAIPRFRTALVLSLAILAAALALLGVYGVVSHSVAQSRRAIGVRMALGAHAGAEVRRVLRGGLRLGVAGVLLGLVMALSLADVLGAFVFGIESTDPVTYLGVGLGVLVVCSFATWVPAQRAAAVEPVSVLKSE